MSDTPVTPQAEVAYVATLQAVVLKAKTCARCGTGGHRYDVEVCSACGAPLGEPETEDLGVVAGLGRPCPQCGYVSERHEEGCTRCGVSLADVEPTEERDVTFLSQLAAAWRQGWQKGQG